MSQGSLLRHPVFALDLSGGVSLLEADAGTGKTWTITGLVIRALLERAVTIDRMLVVTFTRAATAELTERIRERLGQMLQLIDDHLAGRRSEIGDPFCETMLERLGDRAQTLREARQRLRIALAGFDEASVRTIHGFCQRIIDENPLSTGVASGAQVQAASDDWIDRLVASWWREQVLDADPAIIDLIRLADVRPNRLADWVRAAADRPGYTVLPGPVNWRGLALDLAGCRSELSARLDDSWDAFCDWCAIQGNIRRTSYRADYLQQWGNYLKSFCSGGNDDLKRIANAAARLTPASLQAASAKPGYPGRGLIEVCSQLERLLEQCRRLGPALAAELLHNQVPAERLRRYGRGVLDQNDLLLAVAKALSGPNGDRLAASVRQRWCVAFIDESQDTDPIQAQIFRRIYETHDEQPPALVIVGDPKQAIYRFRGADVSAYLRWRARITNRLRLDENQRATAPLIAAVNTLFGQPDAFRGADIEGVSARLGKRTRSRWESEDQATRSPLTVLRLVTRDSGAWLNRDEAKQQSVQAMAAEVSRLLAEPRPRIDGEPLRSSQIAVLVNTHEQGTRVKRALAAVGIGAAEISRDRVFDSRECAELEVLVAAIAEPSQPQLASAAVMGSLFALSAKALSELAADQDQWSAQIRRIARAGEEWQLHGPLAAVRSLLADTGAYTRMARLRDGERRLANLAQLLELMGSDARATRTPAQALRWLGRARDGGLQLESEVAELRLDSDEDLVRIVTVHKSKGLEYPVVFMPFAWQAGRPVSHGAVRRPARSDETLEPGTEGVFDLLPDQAAREGELADLTAEQVRLLYVALTRAQHRCYLCWGPAEGMQYSALSALLLGIDPLSQQRSKHGLPPDEGLAGAAIDRAIEGWASRAALSVADLSADSVTTADTAVIRAIATDSVLAIQASGPSEASPTWGSPASGKSSASDPCDLPAAPSAGARSLQHPALKPLALPRLSVAIQASFSSLSRQGETAVPGEPRSPAPATRPYEIADDALMDTRAAERDDSHIAVPAGEGHGTPADVLPEDIHDALTARFGFPRGAQAGVCLHAMLEDHVLGGAFDRASVSRCLVESGYPQRWTEPVAQWLDEVLTTPLPLATGDTRVSIRLDRPMRAVREFDFLIAAESVSMQALVRCVQREFHLPLEPSLGSWHGFLRGFIDLVFEHEGRWHLLDWKSNYLGHQPAHYSGEALARAMADGAYALQLCLYTLALHRWLRLKQPGYDYDQHVGSGYYVFLRAAGAHFCDAQGAPFGVYTARPSASLIAELDAILGAGR